MRRSICPNRPGPTSVAPAVSCRSIKRKWCRCQPWSRPAKSNDRGKARFLVGACLQAIQDLRPLPRSHRLQAGSYTMKALLFFLLAGSALAADWVREQSTAGAFPLFQEGATATIVTAPEDFK